MTHLGSPDLWIGVLESQLPNIINLIIETWEAMLPPAGNELEDTVSKNLCQSLRQSRSRCDLPFRIDTQTVELDPAAGEDQGRMDIVFSPTAPREDIYFCLECKRLNVRGPGGVRPYFGEYVRFGMARFIRGQYGRHVRFGGMLAFVLDGDVPGALAGVESNIKARDTELGMVRPGGFQPSKIRPADQRLRQTEHLRHVGSHLFVIQHLFMAGDPKAPLRPTSVPATATTGLKKRKRRGSRQE